MATKIQWCDETWNPVVGCSKISPACDNCYAERMANRLAQNPKTKFKYGDVVSDGKWNGKLSMDPNDLYIPGKWKTPKRIFVCSMGDLFHENVPFHIIMEVMMVINDFPRHTFMILTKRAQRMYHFFNKVYSKIGPIPNLWAGVTVENQVRAHERIVPLLYMPFVAKKFVSIEPMLTHVDLEEIQKFPESPHGTLRINSLKGTHYHIISGRMELISDGLPKLDWVICGGETGPKARPIQESWVRSLQVQCEDAGTPFFFKQWGGKLKGNTILGNKYEQFPA
jgi:protein gp37